MIKKYCIAILLCAAVLLQGCALLTGGGAPQARLEQRIHGLMTAKVEGQWDLAYDYFDSNFKSKTPKKRFSAPKKMTFLSYRIENLSMDPSAMQADALVKSDVETNGYDLKGLPENQHWIMENGDWFLSVKPTSGFID